MVPGLLHGGKDTSRHNILSTSITPFDVSRISLLEDKDDFPIGNKLPILSLVCVVELVMGRVILEHVDHVAEVSEGSLIATTFTLLELKTELATQHPIRPNLFPPTVTIMSEGQGCTA